MTTYHSVFSIGYERVASGAEGVRAIDPSFRISSLHQKMTDEDRKVFVQLLDNFAEEHFGARVVQRFDPRGTALALTGYKPQEDEAIQWDRPLYDSDGYEHSLVALGAVEVVTKHSFVYVVWDRKSGKCRREEAQDLTISNTPLSEEVRGRRREEARRILEDLRDIAEKQEKEARLARLYEMLGLTDIRMGSIRQLRSQILSPRMPKEVYLMLQKAVEEMELQAAAGQDQTEHFCESMDLLHSLIDAADWTMHPDYGCVLKSQIDDLDKVAEQAISRDRP